VNVWLVSAVYGRQAVTRLAMRQWAHLRGELAGRGIDLNVVAVGDDGNLETAREFGFDTLERPNVLGRRSTTASSTPARTEPTGSAGPVRISGCTPTSSLRRSSWTASSLADRSRSSTLSEPRMRVLHVWSTIGASPWFIDGATLRKRDWRPVDDDMTHGLDGNLAWSLHGSQRHFIDPNDLCRVDFKSAESMTSYRMLQHLGCGAEQSRSVRRAGMGYYPGQLVRMAAAHVVGVWWPRDRHIGRLSSRSSRPVTTRPT
jgi:hypothetical protein